MVLVISLEITVYAVCLCCLHWFNVARASLVKGDVMYFGALIRI